MFITLLVVWSSVRTRLWTVRERNCREICGRCKDFSLLQSIQTISGIRLASYSKGSGVSAQVKRPECKVDYTSPSSACAEKSYNSRFGWAFMVHKGTNLLLLKGYKLRFVTLRPLSSRNVRDSELVVALSKYSKTSVRKSASGFTQNRGWRRQITSIMKLGVDLIHCELL